MPTSTSPETIELPAAFSIRLFARWADMDFHQHMRNAAYLGASEDCRMRFLTERGFSMDELQKRRLGPVVLEDRLVYKKELKLLESFRVELALSAMARDARRMKLRNTFYREADAAVAAVVDSVVVWLDLTTQEPIVPPDELKSAWTSLARTSDFEWYE